MPTADVSITDSGLSITSGLYDTDDGILMQVAGDSYPRIHITPQGSIKTGPGSAAPTAGEASDEAPESPAIGDLWDRTASGLVASMDYRWLADGEVPNLTPQGDTPVPATNGPGSAGSVPILDPSGLVGPPLTPPAVLDGVLRAPSLESGDSTMIPAYFFGAPETDQARITIAFADILDAEGTSVDGAGINIPWTTGEGSGPIVHFVPYNDDGDVVTRVKVGFDFENTAHLGEDVLLLDRVLGVGDRGALVVQRTDRTWWVEINGEVLDGTSCALVENGADDDVIVDGVVIDTITGHFDFDDLVAASTPTSNSAEAEGANGWQPGYYWIACSEYDYDPDKIGLNIYTESGWVRVGDETQYREATRLRFGTIPASAVLYDNTESGLTATNVQAALDEIAGLVAP